MPVGRPSPYEDIEISNIRAVIAKRLGESKVWHYNTFIMKLNYLFNLIKATFLFQRNIPHSYAAVDINIDKLIELRGKLKTQDIIVSINDFVAKAVAHALVECPDINTLYQNGQVSTISFDIVI